jgi:plasmid stabilization system protein ParE
MSHIQLASEVGDDFERILDHLAKYQVENPALRIREIIEAINVLEHNPMIGRPANNDKRELVIGHRSHGYVALYRYIVEIDTVFVLAVRSQKEAGDEEL